MQHHLKNSALPEVFCWSKMGTEAGQTLDQIVQRKEVERIANNGSFAWGIGSSLGDSAELLQKATNTAKVVFTTMLSKPKLIDEQPEKLFLWLGGRTRLGMRVELPYYSLLTSRGNTLASGFKRSHYALLCRSNSPVELKSNLHLDGASVVNLKSGNPVGSSQVTAVVQKSSSQHGRSRIYKVGFTADLSNHIQIILDQFIEVSMTDIQPAIEAAKKGDIEAWKSKVSALKKQSNSSGNKGVQYQGIQRQMFA